MAKKQTTKAKAVALSLGGCGTSQQDFVGLGTVMLPGSQDAAARNQALAQASAQAQAAAQSWISSINCAPRCFAKSSNVKTISMEAMSEFIRPPGTSNGYTIASATVNVTATVTCAHLDLSGVK